MIIQLDRLMSQFRGTGFLFQCEHTASVLCLNTSVDSSQSIEVRMTMYEMRLDRGHRRHLSAGTAKMRLQTRFWWALRYKRACSRALSDHVDMTSVVRRTCLRIVYPKIALQLAASQEDNLSFLTTLQPESRLEQRK